MAVKETTFERMFCSDLKEHLGEKCMILKLTTRQGIPDRLILYKDKFALLEFKRSGTAKHQPNQDFYIELINLNGGFARFIYPENAEGILEELLAWFGV